MGATGRIEQFLGVPDTPANRTGVVAGIPLGRLSKTHDVANAALWLASDALHGERRHAVPPSAVAS